MYIFQSKMFLQKIAVLFLLHSALQYVDCHSPCANFYSSDSQHHNNLLKVKSGGVVGSLAEEFSLPGKSWNVSGHWALESSSCQLKLCTGNYFTGDCTVFSGGLTNYTTQGFWQSAKCTCSATCSYSRIHLRKSVCARAYLEPTGGDCSVCDASYTELEPTTNAHFPEKWREKVTSLLVRRGCTITLYDEEDLDGESETIKGYTHHMRSTSIGSYECECDDSGYVPEAATISTGSVETVQVPSTMDEAINELSQRNFSHPGMVAALTSLAHKRSSRNAYILMIGSSGAGKSSTINHLLGNQNVTLAGAHESTTSEILEIRIPLVLPELGINNSELRLIDTPGLGDTRGVKNDALFLATLDDYLSDHEELNKRIPNLVMVFHKFGDNRYDGENSQFVKMLRALNSFRDRITDESFSNVIFVFSHFCSVSNQEQRDPSIRLMKFREVIEKYSLFPKPVMMTLAENKGIEEELSMRDNNFELPNGEYFPRNLIDRMQTVTEKTDDKIGNAIFTAAFSENRLGENVGASVTKFNLVQSETHSKVSQYLSILSAASLSISSTEVSRKLADAYQNMNISMKLNSPNCLVDLQRYLHLRNIYALSDVPRTSVAVLELLNEISHDDATAFLLEHGLDFKAPTFPGSALAGRGYSMAKNSILSTSPFRLDEMARSQIGFMVPAFLDSSKLLQQSTTLINSLRFDSIQSYYQNWWLPKLLSADLKETVNSTEIFNALTSKIENGIFVRESSCNGEGACAYTIQGAVKVFSLSIDNKSRAYLNTDFIQRVSDLSLYNQSDYENVERWIKFFDDYGTHVISAADSGGKISFQISVPTSTSRDSVIDTVKKCIAYLESPLEASLKYKQSAKEVFLSLKNITTSLTFSGGNQGYHISDLTKMSIEEAHTLFKKWVYSLEYYPAVFPVEYIRIDELVSTAISQQEGSKIKDAFKHFITSTLVYIPPPLPTPDPKVLEELARIQRENEERLRLLEEEKKKREEALEKARLAQIEEQRRMAEEAARRQREWEEAEARRVREEAERRRVMQLEAERQERERQRQHEENMRVLREQMERQRVENECREQLTALMHHPFLRRVIQHNFNAMVEHCVKHKRG